MGSQGNSQSYLKQKKSIKEKTKIDYNISEFNFSWHDQTKYEREEGRAEYEGQTEV